MNGDRYDDNLAYASAASFTLYERTPQIISVAQPAAGSEWSQTVPAGQLWIVLAFHFTLTTSAAVATRVPRVQFASGSLIFWETVTPSGQAASGQVPYSAAAGSQAKTRNTVSEMTHPTPGALLLSGHTIKTATVSLDVADQYTGVVLQVMALRPRTSGELNEMVEELRAGSPQFDEFAGAELVL